MELTCIVIEDEPLAIQKLEGFIAQIPHLTHRGSFSNALDGLSFLKENPVDILFLDIQMEPLTGIELLEAMREKPYVVITTAYSDYALRGYELRVFDYLLKPYSFERLLSTVEHISFDISAKRGKGSSQKNLFVRTEYRIESIPIEQIEYVEGMQGYLRIVAGQRRVMTKMTFGALLAELPKSSFVQVHRSWVVNINHIISIERNRIKISDKLIPIGESYRDGFYGMLR